jgi:hypothetical protein
MIKLVRNTLADWAVLKNANGEAIKWEYIEALHHLQVRIVLLQILSQSNPVRRAGTE